MKDLVGQKFGRLTVISFNGHKKGRYLWNCKCECGNDCIVEGHRLKTEATRSCGCLRKEINTKHGDYKSRLYKVNGNYEPSNCRWITNFEQQSNKRNNTHIEYQGEIYTKKELARKFNINYATFLYRLNYYGWSVEEAIKPVRKN